MRIFQLFCLVGSGKGVDDLVDTAIHDSVDLVQGQTDTMVCDTTLREIIGADTLIAHTGAHLTATHTGYFRAKPLLFDLVQLGCQHPHTFFPVLQLAAFFLAGDHDAGRSVDQTNSGRGFVNMLTTGTGCPVNLHFNIRRIDLHIHFLHFRKYSHGCGRGVNTATGFGFRHSLHPVHTGFVFHPGVGTTAADDERPLIAMEEEVIRLLNAEREKEGLPHLIADNTHYSKVMLRAQECEEYWSHTRPNGEKWSTVYEGMTNERIKMASENLAKNFITPESIVKALMESEAHRNNILNEKFTHVCIAIHTMAPQEDYPDYTLYTMAQHFYQEEE